MTWDQAVALADDVTVAGRKLVLGLAVVTVCLGWLVRYAVRALDV